MYGDPSEAGILGPYEDTSSICRAAILSGMGTNDDSFYVTFTIVEPVRAYQDPGGGEIKFEKWDRVGDPEWAPYVSDKCCLGGWPPKLGFETNEVLKWRKAFKNEWQNVRAFQIEGAVSELCPAGFKFHQGTRKADDPACVVSAQGVYTPVPGCNQCVEGMCPRSSVSHLYFVFAIGISSRILRFGVFLLFTTRCAGNVSGNVAP